MAKNVYIQDFIGLCNRLECLGVAFAVQKAFGHQIYLEWPELDALAVEGTKKGGPGLFGRIGVTRLRPNFDLETFQGLGQFRNVIIRTYEGPAQVLDPGYKDLPGRLKLKKSYADQIKATFAKAKNRPVAGVHIRQGDFRIKNEEIYDPIGTRHAAVPIWWYEFAMEKIVKRSPEVCFFLSCTGDPSTFASLQKNFDVISLEMPSTYNYKSVEHQSRCHPVADLFALACCPTILATPVSSFSHWAANVLGSKSLCLVPPPQTRRDQPVICQVEFHGRRAPEWFANGRDLNGARQPAGDLSGLDLARPADTNWMQTF